MTEVAALRDEVGLAITELEVTADPVLVLRNLLHRLLHLEGREINPSSEEPA